MCIENREATANNDRLSCHERILGIRNKLTELTNEFLFERTFDYISYNISLHSYS